MAARSGIGLRQTQRLALSPQIAQGLAILQMPALELAAAIAAEAEENPVLQVDESHRPWTGSSALPGDPDNLVAHTGRAERLRGQIAEMSLPAAQQALACYLTECLDEDGYLDEPVAEIAERLDLPEIEIAAGLAALQRCEPAGIGARNLAECLFLQLCDRGEDAETARLVTESLEDLALGRWRVLAGRTALPKEELKRLADVIRTLSPRPWTEDAPETAALIPDVAVRPDGRGGFLIEPLAGALPGLKLAPDPAGKAGPTDKAARRWIAERRDRAARLIRAVDYRRNTLLAVTRALVARQQQFFSGGGTTMAPMTRADLAADLELHPSTIGRALAGKALEAPGGVYPFSIFFTRGLAAGPGEGHLSAFTVQQEIRRLIEAEPPGAPLSDDAICITLREAGVDIARRTVAKYRGCMKIPSSFERRRKYPPQRTRPGR